MGTGTLGEDLHRLESGDLDALPQPVTSESLQGCSGTQPGHHAQPLSSFRSVVALVDVKQDRWEGKSGLARI